MSNDNLNILEQRRQERLNQQTQSADAAAGKAAGRNSFKSGVQWVNVGVPVQFTIAGEIVEEFIQIGGFSMENLPEIEDPSTANTPRKKKILEVKQKLREQMIQRFLSMDAFERSMAPNLKIQLFMNSAMQTVTEESSDIDVEVPDLF